MQGGEFRLLRGKGDVDILRRILFQELLLPDPLVGLLEADGGPFLQLVDEFADGGTVLLRHFSDDLHQFGDPALAVVQDHLSEFIEGLRRFVGPDLLFHLFADREEPFPHRAGSGGKGELFFRRCHAILPFVFRLFLLRAGVRKKTLPSLSGRERRLAFPWYHPNSGRRPPGAFFPSVTGRPAAHYQAA